MKISYGPREKLEEKGISSLSDEEILAILIKTGSKTENVLELSKRILDEIDSPQILSDYTFQELMQFKGIGRAKAMTICCSIELSNRIRKRNKNLKSIKTSKDVIEYCIDDFLGLTFEKVDIIFLNSNLKILSKHQINNGVFNKAYLDTREILKRSLKLNASFIVIVHNHPGGSAIPSLEDRDTLNKLEELLNNFDITIYDSIIVTDYTYFSMKYSIKENTIDWLKCVK